MENITITLTLTPAELAVLRKALDFASSFDARHAYTFAEQGSAAAIFDMLPGAFADDEDADHREDSRDFCDDMDGDHASALASAGFGTDEDYEHPGMDDGGEW